LEDDFELLATVSSYDQTFFRAEGLTPGMLYSFKVTSVNAIGESVQSQVQSHFAQSKPGKPNAPVRIAEARVGDEVDGFTAEITLRWGPLVESGGVACTGFKLFMRQVETGAEEFILIFDGTGHPEIVEYTATDLIVDVDTEFYLIGLNPLESEPSSTVVYRSGARPSGPTDIRITEGSRTGKRLGLEWTVPSDDGGSPILFYTLVWVQENQADEIMYFGANNYIVLDELTSGRLYSFRVQATNLVGTGIWSDQYTFLVVDKPTSPLDLRCLEFDDKMTVLKWD
jgi:hypothetical protein